MSDATARNFLFRSAAAHDSRIAESSRPRPDSPALSDRANQRGVPPPALPGQSTVPTLPLTRALRVLVAEDNFANQLIAKTLLLRAGYDVTTANDGAQAARVSAEKSFDLILMDIEMPELSGLEVTEHIRSCAGPNQNTLIVALTAYGSATQRYVYRHSGINHVLTKPFKIARLETLLGRQVPAGIQTIAPAAADKDAMIDEETIVPLLEAAGKDGLATVIKSYWRSAYALHADIQDAHEVFDRDRLQKSAHALKGASINIGLPGIARLAAQLQNAKTETAPQLLSALDDVLAKSRKALSQRMAQSP